MLRILESISQVGLGKGWDGGIHNEIEVLLSLKESVGLSRIVALDVGANRGSWTSTLKLLDPFSEIHAFEPSSATFEVLKLNLQNLDDVYLYPIALGNLEGKGSLFSNFETSPLASLSMRRLEHQDIVFSNTEEIDVTTLDSWIMQNPDFEPNILKIDVEGHELEVLQGGLSLLPQIRIIQFEFGGTDIDSKVFFQDFWYFFLPRNFKIYRLTPKGLLEIEGYSENEEIFKFSTLYAVSRESAP
ncbi:MAG: FkbM family methyltransferase [Actinobacteria bacterium]|nr:FkbM family methyltransferase [Actinomycetota bacterium]